jgi:tetratricopeptide (TPR) repeat protein
MMQDSLPLTDLLKEATALHTAGRLAEAEERYRKILKSHSDHAEATHLFGVLRLQQGNPEEAVGLIERAVTLQPDVAAMHVNLGAAYRANTEASKAEIAYRKALNLDSSLTAAFFNLGHTLRELEDFDGAVNAYKAYLERHPQDAEAHTLLADTYVTLNQYDNAIDAYETALIYDPQRAKAVSNIATILKDRGWYHAARVIMERAARMEPADHDIRSPHGAICLLFGDFESGWTGLESRFYTSTEQIILRPAPPAYWSGEDLSGKSIVVWTEQGLGDEVLHASILHEVIERAARCVIECSKRMVPVFARSFPTATIEGYEASNFPVTTAEEIDYQIPLGSLGQYFRPDFASFPHHQGYLKADPDKVAEIRARYEALAGGRRIVGISWRSKNEQAGEAKSTALRDMAPILQVPGVMFVNLQYGDCAEELTEAREHLGVEILQDTAVDPLTDMDAFFAQVSALDLVLSTSNTTAHVAGAQNIPVWVLLTYGSKGLLWYWFLRRTDSPWYPSARLIRVDHKLEDGPKRWLELAERTASDLARWTET